MPARLRCFDEADWPDDGADDGDRLALLARSWPAMSDPADWWWSQPHRHRAESRWHDAQLRWCKQHGRSVLDLLREDYEAICRAYGRPVELRDRWGRPKDR